MLDNILKFFNEACQKLYITIPVILAFISSFSGTIIYKFSKLITNARILTSTTTSVVQTNKKLLKQIKHVRKQQSKFQTEVCKTLKAISTGCLPHKREEIKLALEKVESLIENDDLIDADFEEILSEENSIKTRKIKVKKIVDTVKK